MAAQATTAGGARPIPKEMFDPIGAQAAEDYLRNRVAILNFEGVGVPATDGYLVGCTLTDLLVVLKSHLSELSARAVQDPDAAETLHSFACVSCENLWEICVRNPEAAVPWASRKMRFPVVWPLLKKNQEKVLKLVKQLGVGTNGIFRVGRKGFDPDKPANMVVSRWVARISSIQSKVRSEWTIQQARASVEGKDYSPSRITSAWLREVMALKRLNSSTAPAWANVIWQGILDVHNGKPEQSSELRHLGEHRAKHSLHEGQQTKVTNGTVESNIRDGIRKRIKQVVRDLSRRSPDGICAQ